MPQIWKNWALGAIAGLISNLWLSGGVQAAASNPIRQAIACPERLVDLLPLLLRDLPSYANRVNQRAYLTDTIIPMANNPDTPGYVLLAGQPDYRALTLSPDRLPSDRLPSDRLASDAPQIFFTTLERQYAAGKAVKLQHYHWLFLTQTQSYGW